MNNIPLTSLFASLFTIFYLFLSFRIGYLRGKHAQKKVTAIKLDRNVRAHGNFSEYVPLFLILLYIFESVDLISSDQNSCILITQDEDIELPK